MFDTDSAGSVQVALLPQETLTIPFSFITFEPYFSSDDRKTKRVSRAGESKDDNDDMQAPSGEIPTSRIANVRIISGSHGHVVSVAKVHLHFRPFVVHRNISFYEPENSVMKRRIRLTGPQSRRSQVPGQYNGVASKYVHCVETGTRLGADGGGNQVLVEWGDCEEDSGENCLNLVLRYRCLEFPSVGSFYILLYNDPYQCNLYEVLVKYVLFTFCVCIMRCVDIPDMAIHHSHTSKTGPSLHPRQCHDVRPCRAGRPLCSTSPCLAYSSWI